MAFSIGFMILQLQLVIRLAFTHFTLQRPKSCGSLSSSKESKGLRNQTHALNVDIAATPTLEYVFRKHPTSGLLLYYYLFYVFYLQP